MMPNPFAELPLALFSSIVPIAVGALLLVVAVSTMPGVQAARRKMLGRLAFVPVGFLALGIIAAMFHLASPQNALFVAMGIGRSPLSNEVMFAGVFLALALVYAVCAIKFELGKGPRVVALVILGVLGVVLVVSTGLAYFIETVPGWASPWAPVAMVGYMLAGTSVGALLVAWALPEISKACRAAVASVVTAGVAVAAIANMAHLAQVGAMGSMLMEGAALTASAMPYAMGALVLGVIACVCCWLVVKNEEWKKGAYAVAAALVLVGVFLARLSFYCLQLGVGL